MIYVLYRYCFTMVDLGDMEERESDGGILQRGRLGSCCSTINSICLHKLNSGTAVMIPRVIVADAAYYKVFV